MPIKKTNGKQKLVIKKKLTIRKQGANQLGGSTVQRAVTAPVAQTFQLVKTQPKIDQKLNTIRIKHSEYFWDVVNTSSSWGIYNATAGYYKLNPANGNMFPWLSVVSQNWERYRFHSVTIRYIPRCSTATNGFVQIYHDADVLDTAPNNEIAFMANSTARDTPAWKAMNISIGSERLNGDYKHKYIGTPPTNADPKTYDSGQLFIALGGDSVNFGKLVVDYDVELSMPAMHYRVPSVYLTADYTTSTYLLPLGENPKIDSYGWKGSWDKASNKLTITGIPVGTWFSLVYTANNPTANVLRFPDCFTFITSGVTLKEAFLQNPVGYIGITSSSGQYSTGGVYQVTGPVVSFVLYASGSTTGAYLNFGQVNVSPIAIN